MATSWHVCMNELKQKHPGLDNPTYNRMIQTIWTNPANKAEWQRHYDYEELQKNKKRPELQSDPEYQFPQLDGSKVKVSKSKKKVVIQEPESSSEEEVEKTPPPKRKNKKNIKAAPNKNATDKDADYYRQKYYQEKLKAKK